MSALRRDLLERKLWPVVALLVVALVAVPVLLLKSTAAGSSALPPAPPAANTSSESTTTATTQAPANEPTKVVLARIARDPFASGVPKLSSKPAPASQGSSSSSSSTSAPTGSASAESSTVAMVSPSPAPGSATSGSTGGSGSAGSSTGSATTPTSAPPTSTIASAPPTTQAGSPDKVQSWTIYSVSIRFGKEHAPARNNIPRLAALPSAGNPQVMFFGVLSGGKQAVFGLNAGVAHTGQGLCRPSRTSCSAIVLSPGQTEEVAWATDSGRMVEAILQLDKITSTITHSRQKALQAYKRVSTAGICDLSLSQPVSYDPETGTVQNFPKDACKAQAASAPFAFLKLKSAP